MQDGEKEAAARPPVMNFAAAAKRESREKDLKGVQLTGLVLLKIVRHCNSCLPSMVTGQLLGLDVGSTLEVTDCFPFPIIKQEIRSHKHAPIVEEEQTPESANYQLEMMRCLREVNVDNNTVGWYQSTNFSSFQTIELLDTFINYYESIPRCVCIVYDPKRSSGGNVALKAIKLCESFIEIYKAEGMPGADAITQELNWKNIFQEVPISIQNSSLVSALMMQLDRNNPASVDDTKRLSLDSTGFIEKNLTCIGDCVDDLVQEQRKLASYHRNVVKQQQQFQQWLQARRQENARRAVAGEDLLPEEDPVLFKPLQEPSQIDACLVTHQMNNYSEQMSSFASGSLEKLYLAEGFQKSRG